MPNFDNLVPPKRVTDPDPTDLKHERARVHPSPHYPQFLYRFVPMPTDGTTVEDAVIVAWQKKTPVLNGLLLVKSEAERNVALADAWSAEPVVVSPAPVGKRKE